MLPKLDALPTEAGAASMRSCIMPRVTLLLKHAVWRGDHPYLLVALAAVGKYLRRH